jgi:hypothetical protein
MKLQHLLIVASVVAIIPMHAQSEKTTEHLFTANPTGTIHSLFNRTGYRGINLGIRLEYQWKFSAHFSAGLNGGISAGRITPTSNSLFNYSIQPEFRYWFSTPISRLQPFAYTNYGLVFRQSEGINGTYRNMKRSGAVGIGLTGWLNNSWGIQGKYDIIKGSDGSAVINVPVQNLHLSVVYRPGQRNKGTNTQQ